MARKTFPKHCIDEYEYLAENFPEELVELVRSGELEPTDLTFAAETLGRVQHKDTEGLLVGLLKHPESYVREGALYGLMYLSPTKKVYIAVQELSYNDPNDFVRRIASEVIEDYEDDVIP